MNILDKDYWQQRYENGDIGWDVGSVTTPIKEYIDHLGTIKNMDKGIKLDGFNKDWKIQCANALRKEALKV